MKEDTMGCCPGCFTQPRSQGFPIPFHKGKVLEARMRFMKSTWIERFHSRGQQPCKCIGTKESLVWDTNMAAVSLFWDTNMAAVTSCENTPYECMKHKFFNMHLFYIQFTYIHTFVLHTVVLTE